MALSTIPLAMIIFGAVDVTNIFADRAHMKSIADGAALSGAKLLSVALNDAAAAENAKSMAAGMVAEWRSAPAITTTAEIVSLGAGLNGVKVTLGAKRPSLFGNLLPPGGWNYAVASTASPVGTKPLCMLAFDDRQARNFDMAQSARINAPGCLIHSNADLVVRDQAHVEAGQAEAVGSASGDITPAAITDVPAIEDPFAARSVTMPSCKGRPLNFKLQSGSMSLPPGAHCGAFQIGGDATLTLEPGEHYFLGGALILFGKAKLRGADVVLIQDKTSELNIHEDASVDLTGRESGANAGFVIISPRDNSGTFRIDSTHVARLDGVIYVPAAELAIGGVSDVARQSNWTVVVARRITMSGSPSLYLNTNYAGSPIAPPPGVGPRSKARLVK